MIQTSFARNSQELAGIMHTLLGFPLYNQLILGDIHAPMNEISDIYKITEGDKIIGGWSVFRGFDIPIIILPPLLPQSWDSIRNMLPLLNLNEFYATFPRYDHNGDPFELPWQNWDEYQYGLEFNDHGMQLENKEIAVQDISMLPKIRGVTNEDAEPIAKYFGGLGSDYQGFFHPAQIKTDVYVVAEDNDLIVAIGGAHFETPLSVQIGNIHVSEDYRGIGLGRAITTAVTLGIIHGKRLPTLFVNENNKVAQNLYRSIGFVKYNEFGFYRLTKNN